MGNITDRVLQLLTSWEMSPSAFADAIQIPRAIMSHILSRRNKPSLEVIQKILLKYPQVNADWLLNNVGEMTQLNLFDNLEKVQTPLLYVDDASQSAQLLKEPTTTIHNKTIEKKATPILEKNNIEKNAPEITPSNKMENVVRENFIVKEEEQAEYLKKTKLPKQIEKIIIFYTDKSFSIHNPE